MARMTKDERCNAFIRNYKTPGPGWPMFAIEEQDRREGPLVAALRTIRDHGTATPVVALMSVQHMAARAIADYDALDAKPDPTLAELVKAADARASSMRDKPGQMYAAVLLEDWLAVKAAVEREERCAGERKGK